MRGSLHRRIIGLMIGIVASSHVLLGFGLSFQSQTDASQSAVAVVHAEDAPQGTVAGEPCTNNDPHSITTKNGACMQNVSDTYGCTDSSPIIQTAGAGPLQGISCLRVMNAVHGKNEASPHPAGGSCDPDHPGSIYSNSGACVLISDTVLQGTGCPPDSNSVQVAGDGPFKGIPCLTLVGANKSANTGSNTATDTSGSAKDIACGGEGIFNQVNPIAYLLGAICGMVKITTDMINGFLLSGVVLLATQANNIPHCDPLTGQVAPISGVNTTNYHACEPMRSPTRVGVATSIGGADVKVSNENVRDSDLLLQFDKRGAGVRNITDDIQDVLMETAQGSFGLLVRTAYNRVLQFCDVLLILFFILIAIANILQVRMNIFNIRKILPTLIIAFIAAHFSFFLVRAGLELSGQIASEITGLGNQAYSFQGIADAFSNVPFNHDDIAGTDQNGKQCEYRIGIAYYTTECKADAWPDIGKLMRQSVTNFFTLAPAILLFVLGFLFIVRRLVFFFIVPLAPLAFLSLGFPPLTSTIWGKWSKLVTNWLLVPTVASFWMWLALVWFNSGNNNSGLVTTIASYGFGLGCLFAAIKTPFSFAGDAKFAVDKLNQYGKTAWGKTGGAALGAAGGATKNGLLLGRNWAMNNTKAGQMAGGVYRGVKGWRANTEESIKEGTHKWQEGPIDQTKQTQARRNELKEALKQLEKDKDSGVFLQQSRFQQNEAQLKADVSRLQNEYDSLKTGGGTPQQIDAKQRELQAANLQLRQVHDSIEKEYKAQHEQLQAAIQAPQSTAERFDMYLSKQKMKRDLDKSEHETSKSVLDSYARQDLVKNNHHYQEAMADLEAIKESTGIIDELTKSIIRQKKNELQTNDSFNIALRKQKEHFNAMAEEKESARELAFINSLKKDGDLLEEMQRAKVHKDVRDKALSKAVGERGTEMVRDWGTEQRIIRAVDTGDILKARELAATMRESAEKSAIIASLSDPQAPTVDMIRTAIDNARITSNMTPDEAKRVKDVNSAERRRVTIDVNNSYKDDVKRWAETGEWKDKIFKFDPGDPTNDKTNNWDKLAAVLRDDHPEKIDSDTASATAAFSTALSSGDLVNRDAQEARAVFQHIKSLHPTDAQFGNDLDVLDDLLAQLETNTMTGKTETMSEQERRKLVKNFMSSQEARRLGIDKDVAGRPTILYGDREGRV